MIYQIKRPDMIFKNLKTVYENIDSASVCVYSKTKGLKAQFPKKSVLHKNTSVKTFPSKSGQFR